LARPRPSRVYIATPRAKADCACARTRGHDASSLRMYSRCATGWRPARRSGQPVGGVLPIVVQPAGTGRLAGHSGSRLTSDLSISAASSRHLVGRALVVNRRPLVPLQVPTPLTPTAYNGSAPAPSSSALVTPVPPRRAGPCWRKRPSGRPIRAAGTGRLSVRSGRLLPDRHRAVLAAASSMAIGMPSINRTVPPPRATAWAFSGARAKPGRTAAARSGRTAPRLVADSFPPLSCSSAAGTPCAGALHNTVAPQPGVSRLAAGRITRIQPQLPSALDHRRHASTGGSRTCPGPAAVARRERRASGQRLGPAGRLLAHALVAATRGRTSVFFFFFFRVGPVGHLSPATPCRREFRCIPSPAAAPAGSCDAPGPTASGPTSSQSSGAPPGRARDRRICFGSARQIPGSD